MKNSPFKNVFFLAIGLAFLVVLSGCASGPEPIKDEIPAQSGKPGAAAEKPGAPGKPGEQPPEEAETYYTHTVKWPGESVSIIAGWYTGDVQNWKTLAEANPDINPDRIHEGMKLRIPESMMKTKLPMTKDYVDSHYPKPKKPAKGPASPKGDEPVLFGPKQYPSK